MAFHWKPPLFVCGDGGGGEGGVGANRRRDPPPPMQGRWIGKERNPSFPYPGEGRTILSFFVVFPSSSSVPPPTTGKFNRTCHRRFHRRLDRRPQRGKGKEGSYRTPFLCFRRRRRRGGGGRRRRKVLPLVLLHFVRLQVALEPTPAAAADGRRSKDRTGQKRTSFFSWTVPVLALLRYGA